MMLPYNIGAISASPNCISFILCGFTFYIIQHKLKVLKIKMERCQKFLDISRESVTTTRSLPQTDSVIVTFRIKLLSLLLSFSASGF
jgi:hypothetical protein